MFFFPGLEGKEIRKRNRGNLPTWEEAMGILGFQSLFASSCLCCSGENFISLAFLFPRDGEIHVECKNFWNGTRVSGFIERLSWGFPCPGYRTKLRFSHDGLSLCAAGNRIYYAVVSFCQHCIQILYVQKVLGYDTEGYKTEWRDLCLGTLIEELTPAFLTSML